MGEGMSAAMANQQQQRLSEQLEALSLVSETLTLRLLELEQRLTSLEDQLLELQVNGLDQQAQGASGEILLAATEARISRLEDLLNGQPQALPRHLQPLPSVRENPGARYADAPERQQELDSTASMDEASAAEIDPFPEDEEQPFMDELSA